ncbi:hypothetical protein [Rhodopseudomonas rhenobacensis]|uniref:hypothetical protein n=1 Tax=Rhodopseudomonas rhenobacensis TaxID=87461 RepID=UPI00161C4806|nr:hypothetical protein [Rhodopseudomonas rhenobacensis]
MARKDVPDDLVCLAVAVSKSINMTKWPPEILSEFTGQPIKVCYSAMERSYDHGLIECGVSLRSGWLTDKGKALLWANKDRLQKMIESAIASTPEMVRGPGIEPGRKQQSAAKGI